MQRLTMSNLPELRSNPSNEFSNVIDLTGDSPVVRSRFRSSHSRNAQPMRTNLWEQTLHAESLAAPPSFHESLRSVRRHNSSIQVIDADEVPLMVRSIEDVQQTRAIDGAKSNEEYTTAVPCIIDPCNGEHIVLSCPICFDPLVAEQKPMATSCGHIFCAMCLKQTLQGTSNKTCPKCNGPVKLKSCIRLYL